MTHSLREKVDAIFREIAGDRADALDPTKVQVSTADLIGNAIAKDRYPDEHDTTRWIGFHLTDWNAEAAFLVALHLFPERFTPDEINEGALALVIHAPHHLIAAARLYGLPAQDVFAELEREDGIVPLGSEEDEEDNEAEDSDFR